jgi:LuxR family transcriptional regulator
VELRLIQAYCLEALENLVKETKPAPAGNSLLTRRERECLVLAARGFTEKQTARKLSISPFTVHTHNQNAKFKLGARNKLGAVLKGLSLNEIMPADTETA